MAALASRLICSSRVIAVTGESRNARSLTPSELVVVTDAAATPASCVASDAGPMRASTFVSSTAFASAMAPPIALIPIDDSSTEMSLSLLAETSTRWALTTEPSSMNAWTLPKPWETTELPDRASVPPVSEKMNGSA